ncbi:hypothetical protein GCM10023340_07100 [Nocardioides marinquilinus]|uniref:Secreted protein n=1 Tax=Nocardioides marinquilinus TaxID=1210400 RepID=A0ABP9P993_9ACTN
MSLLTGLPATVTSSPVAVAWAMVTGALEPGTALSSTRAPAAPTDRTAAVRRGKSREGRKGMGNLVSTRVCHQEQRREARDVTDGYRARPYPWVSLGDLG